MYLITGWMISIPTIYINEPTNLSKSLSNSPLQSASRSHYVNVPDVFQKCYGNKVGCFKLDVAVIDSPVDHLLTESSII